MARFSQRAQLGVETVVLLLCALLVVAFYGILVTLVVGVWATRNDVTVRIAMTVFALAWFWPIAHALIWRRARRHALLATSQPIVREGENPPAPVAEREVDLTVFERERAREPQAGSGEHLPTEHRGRAASV
jgi:hypothetical protein